MPLLELRHVLAEALFALFAGERLYSFSITLDQIMVFFFG